MFGSLSVLLLRYLVIYCIYILFKNFKVVNKVIIPLKRNLFALMEFFKLEKRPPRPP